MFFVIFNQLWNVVNKLILSKWLLCILGFSRVVHWWLCCGMLYTTVTALIRGTAHRSCFKIGVMIYLMWMLISTVSILIYKAWFIWWCALDTLPVNSGTLEITRVILRDFQTLYKFVSLAGSAFAVSYTLNCMLHIGVN
jgi:hypothetical protein